MQSIHTIFNTMFFKPFIILVLICLVQSTNAQQIFPTTIKETQADTIEVIQLNEAVVFGKRKWDNDTSRYRFNQMKAYMKIVLPYALEAAKLFNEIDSVSVNMTDGQRRKYARSREAELKSKFSSKLKKLNVYQGKLLVKMINRQTKHTCFDMIATIHNAVRANIDQGWAKLNGINLNENYNPDHNKDFERIMRGFGY
jgi:Domain of unknown function (DUF4294)